MEESEIVLVTTTFGDVESAERLASELVDTPLAACVHVEDQVRSYFQWEGEKNREIEAKMTIKTRRAKLKELTDWLVQHHPYDEPEILASSVIWASKGYTSFVLHETGG